MIKALRSLIRDEQGQGLVEYGLLLVLIAIFCYGAVQTLGQKVSTVLSTAGADL